MDVFSVLLLSLLYQPLLGFWASKDSSTVKNDNVIEFTKEDAADIDDKVWENVEIAIKANNVIVNNFDKALSGEISL